ncbi:LysR family transcriptional regulator [Ciceribacter sp. L1K23]|uniref:LysR substrate-binding domain-containing protein n=1 Tax=unclassified Ciceribacter TaxID=2628820 RepID=UPI001ABEACB6|nr:MULTISPECIES: LysR substrate-binding domain-containing protein [unclassified Ciceribacter]MBO3760438.1 LysR family transcriptional regulator [Ciceribacter sp. L1K22]MBR0555506.1 LysR family transcriptional regulator [Ciceribacter sp. L1K23]
MTLSFRQPLPLLDNDVLRTFVAIAESGSFSTAADLVFRTPSAVSMQIKKLEEQLNTALFLRDARSVRLTAGGETLLPYARRMLALSNEAVSRFRMPDMQGVVRLGAPDDIGERFMPNILRRFAEVFPSIMVDLTVDTSGALRRRLQEQRLDLTLVNCSPGVTALDGEVVMKEQLVWAGAKCGTAHLREPLPVSIWEDGCCWRADALTRLDKEKRAYRIAYLSAHTMAQRAAVIADLAVAPLPRSYLTDDMTALGSRQGLPELGAFEVRLLRSETKSEPVEAVADSIRFAFSEMSALAAA